MDVDPDEFEADPGAFDVPDSVVGFMAGELGTCQGAGRNRSEPKFWPEKSMRSQRKCSLGITSTD